MRMHAYSTCLPVCVCVGIFVCLSLTETMRAKKKKKGQDEMVKGISGCSVHILPHRQAERSSFYCKWGLEKVQCRRQCVSMFGKV